MRRTHRVVAAAVLALACPLGAWGAPVLDQSNLVTPTGNFTALFTSGGGVPSTATQTFTAGLSGQLTEIRVVVDPRGSPTANLVLNIRGTTGGVATGPVLASASVAPFAGTNPLVPFDLTAAGLNVAPGDVLAFTLTSAATLGSDYLARAVPGNTYGAGEFTNSNGAFATGGGWDAIFQTFVVVPEPSAMAVLPIGALLLGARRRA